MFSEGGSDNLAVSVEGVSKSYRIFARPEDRLKQVLWRGRRRYFSEFWALRGISFGIEGGQTVGLMGRNGSGKSTLLEVVAGTLEPTEGHRRTRGRTSAILELGTGFDPDFTGRENARIGAAVAGLSAREVETGLDAILDFAEIGEFIDQPVSTYSSGMLVRLAFAVAVGVQPDVLLVDEALAVGDEAFQRKCYARLREVQEAGAAVLFASHDPTHILSLCSAAILLDEGEMLLFARPKEVVEKYHRLLFAAPEAKAALREQIRGATPAAAGVSELPSAAAISRGSGEDGSRFDPALVPESTVSYQARGAEIQDPRLHTATGERVNVLVRGQSYVYSYRVRFHQAVDGVRFGMLVKTKAGFELGGGSTSSVSEPGRETAPGELLVVQFRFDCRLLPGLYFLNAGVLGQVGGEETYLHRVLDAVAFRVSAEESLLPTGIVDFAVQSRVETVVDE